MKTKEQLIERYNHLYEKMKESKDVKNMKIFGEAEKSIFIEMTSIHPEIANKWVEKLEAICWNNYLSEEECKMIGSHIVNQDGTKGYHWEYAMFKNHVSKHGFEEEEPPYYNCYALHATINMIYSDHAKSISEDMGHATIAEVPEDKMFKSCYRKALEKLKDKDRPFFVRKYFKHEMSV